MESEYVEVWERIYFDSEGKATRWFKSMNKGETWLEVDCSIYPDGRPPFIRINDEFNNVAWIEQRTLTAKPQPQGETKQ